MPKVARSGDLACQKIAAPGMPGANPFRSRPTSRSSGWYNGPTNMSFPRSSRAQAKFPKLLSGAGKAARADGPERLPMVRQMWFAAVLIYWGRRPLRAPIVAVRGVDRQTRNPPFPRGASHSLRKTGTRTFRSLLRQLSNGGSCQDEPLRIRTLKCSVASGNSSEKCRLICERHARVIGLNSASEVARPDVNRINHA
jgi:hypothetical protein